MIRFLNWLLHPKKALIITVYISTLITCALAITLIFVSQNNELLTILSYFAYAVAFLLLSYSTYITVIHSKSILAFIKRTISRSKLGAKIISRYDFRTMAFASLSTCINITFVVIHVVLAIITSAPFWYGSMALYYAALASSRYGILIHQKNKATDFAQTIAIKRYRICGIILSILPLLLLPPIIQTIFMGKAFTYDGLWIFAFALYAFIKITTAIYNVIKSRKQRDVTIQAIRCIGLADAMVSIFSLQTALLHTFSDGSFGVFNVITGSTICVATITLGIYMIINSNKKIIILRGQNNERKKDF